MRTEIRKFPVEFGRRFAVSGVRFCWCLEVPEIVSCAIGCNRGGKSRAIAVDSLWESGAVTSTVLCVAESITFSKIANSVVKAVTIPVVNFRRFVSRHYFPYDAMGKILNSINTYAPIKKARTTPQEPASLLAYTFGIPCRSDALCWIYSVAWEVTQWPLSPCQASRFRVIQEALVKIRTIWQYAGGHWFHLHGTVNKGGVGCDGLASPALCSGTGRYLQAPEAAV
jgi:hypothetical protein